MRTNLVTKPIECHFKLYVYSIFCFINVFCEISIYIVYENIRHENIYFVIKHCFLRNLSKILVISLHIRFLNVM